MPTIPLFQTPPNPDAWHRVRAPGGYEWWTFTAANDDGQTEISASFCDGHPLHPKYLAAYKKYRRKPTLNAPPTPADFPLAGVTIRRTGKRQKHYQAAGNFTSGGDAIGVSVGLNEFHVDVNGVVHVSAGDKKRAAIELAFTSLPVAPLTISLQANHQWIMPAGRCEVVGTVWVKGRSSPFKGAGFREHYFGTGPLENDVRSWFGGHLFLGQSVLAFHILPLQDRQAQATIRLVEMTHDSLRELAVTAASMDMHGPVRFWGEPYPRRVQISDLVLSSPKIITSRPRWRRLTYEATFAGLTGRAVCEMIHPGK